MKIRTLASVAWLAMARIALAQPVTVPGAIPYFTQTALLAVTQVGTTPTRIALGGAASHIITICTSAASVGNLWLDVSPAASPVVGQGSLVPSGGGCLFINPAPLNAIWGISDNGTVTINAWGG